MREFVRTYLVALVGFSILALAVIIVVGLQSMFRLQDGGPRPTIAQSASYVLRYATGGSRELRPLVVDPSGDACTALSASDLLYRACVLTTNVDPSVIASDAHGALNTADTPALIAITWRARLDADAEDCARAGLLDERLQQCERDARDPGYSARDSGIIVEIDLARATGSPS